MGIELLIEHLEKPDCTDNSILENSEFKCFKELKIKPSLVTKIDGTHRIYSGVKIGKNSFFPLVIVDQNDAVYFIDGGRLDHKKCSNLVRLGFGKKLKSNYEIFVQTHPDLFVGVETRLYACLLNKGEYLIKSINLK